MKKIDVKTLDPGMIFSEPVYIEGDNFLVPAGMEIRNRDLENLAKMGITVVYTEGELVKKVSSEPVMEQNTKTQDSAAEKDNQDHTDLSDFSGRAKKTTGNGHSTAAVLENKGAYRNYIDLIE
ncbi:MAG: DUF3391 domain-containing protein, partial [Treponema sp.]|nr:DUF3391 domain-containing protein [Treponema sp.]